MTRIVGGVAKGRRLAVPQRGTRPTSERAREALFNSLRGLLDIDGARVLDLFAGTGAVGLEALSRGAAAVEFVESDRGACEIVKRNITTVALDGAVLHRRQAAPFLVGTTADVPFDLVFADPPYAYGEAHLSVLLQTLVEGGWLAENAVIVVERSARGAEPEWPEEYELVKQKRYGEGVLWYGRAR
ncbi:16S rRNA (guanine(966)-N(2))-methyltransferase RsmD [Jatrophihabitans sp.]|uniref:16S rRNA (guanine(966)-N(2))-methyltransferase RsmD n=1 Tax=Jatrophihabitans sp. TaxID=1932789 RepID=UPI0030C77A65|nr:rRNA ((966)-N(2))-methyltransferase RsmD [Jatrophihabitans sp.]